MNEPPSSNARTKKNRGTKWKATQREAEIVEDGIALLKAAWGRTEGAELDYWVANFGTPSYVELDDGRDREREFRGLLSRFAWLEGNGGEAHKDNMARIARMVRSVKAGVENWRRREREEKDGEEEEK